MKKDNWLFVLIAVLLLITLVHGADAQRKFKHNYNVKVHRVDQLQLIGKLVDATPDSLIILEKRRVVVGCRVDVVLINDVSIPGEVVTLTDQTIEIKPKYGLNQLVYFKQIQSIKVRSYPRGYDERIRRNTAIPVSNIQKLLIAKESSGTNGALIGAVVAGAIGYGVGYQSYSGGMFGPSISGGGMAILFIPIGAVMGAAIGKTGRTYKIDGNPVLMEEMMNKLTKKAKHSKANDIENVPVVQSDPEKLTPERQ